MSRYAGLARCRQRKRRLKDFYNLEVTVVVKDEPGSDSTLMNFIKNTTKDYTRDQLCDFFEDEDEVVLYLDLINPSLIKESTSSNVIVETADDKKRMPYLPSGL
jgi:hypothetical protein